LAYTPGSTQVLEIFEPRYRKMISDILMSGGRRFVTTLVSSDDEDKLAEVGVVLYLEDLEEVSQQTNDTVKYICSHTVLDCRVRIKHVLNEGDWSTGETYLRCEVEELVDDDEIRYPGTECAEISQLEASVRDALRDVADMQDEEGKEDAGWDKLGRRFGTPETSWDARDAVGKLDAGRGVGTRSLWGIVELWKDFLDARAEVARRRVKKDFENRMIKFLSEKNGVKPDKRLLQAVVLSELPADLTRDMRTLRDRVMDDVEPIVEEQTSGVQRLVQASSYAERLRLFERMLANEKNRLVARKVLRNTLASLEDKFSAPVAEKPDYC
jgi:Lon protease-like protein